MSSVVVGDPELVVDAHAELGEGPVWDVERRVLHWLNITASEVHTYDPATGADTVICTPSHVGAVAVRRRGGLLMALVDGVWLLDPGADEPRRLAAIGADRPDIRANDGKCDALGRFWIGTMAYDQREGAAALYRVDGAGGVETMLTGLTIANGLAWTADRRTFYYIDTPTRRVDAFDHDPATGEISRRRPFVTGSPEGASPDGMTIDSDDHIWVAYWGGSCVRRYAPDATLDAEVRLPASQVSSCTFGGDDLRDLYITTAAGGLSAADGAAQPRAGGLFRVRCAVAGVAADRFDG